MKKKTYDYASLVSGYFQKLLAGTKNVSVNTIHSYRDTFVIFNEYLEKKRGFKLEKTCIGDLSRDIVLDFLSYLETDRGVQRIFQKPASCHAEVVYEVCAS